MKHLYLSWVCIFSFLAVIFATDPEKSGCLEREKALTILEAVEDLLSKAKISLPSCKEEINSTNSSECKGNKPLAYIEVAKKLISDARENFPTCIGPNVIVQYDKYRDCSEILTKGHKESGVYTISPSESNTTGKPLQVYCDMETDGGGWTVIQRRGKFPVQQDFDQDWETYKNGFGNVTEEFWLGNENIRVLCHKGCEIRFDLQANNGTKGYAVYKNFNLTRNNYTIYISDYTGDIGDSMQDHNNWPFSTKDKGKDKEAMRYPGGWWFNISYDCVLNGIYQPGRNGWEGIVWYKWLKVQCLSSTEIKVKPK